jgi:AmiR/NasT family two-component response regulator
MMCAAFAGCERDNERTVTILTDKEDGAAYEEIVNGIKLAYTLNKISNFDELDISEIDKVRKNSDRIFLCTDMSEEEINELSAEYSDKDIIVPLYRNDKKPEVAENVYLNWLNPDGYNYAASNYLQKNNKKNRIVLFTEYPDNSGIEATLKAQGIVSVSFTYEPGAVDFNVYITRIKLSEPDVIVLYAESPTASNILKQMRAQGVAVPVVILNEDAFDYSFTGGSEFGNTVFFGYCNIGTEEFKSFMTVYGKPSQEAALGYKTAMQFQTNRETGDDMIEINYDVSKINELNLMMYTR